MRLIDNLLEQYVDDFNTYELEEINEKREDPVDDLTVDQICFDEKRFLNDLLDGDLKLFKNYLCDDFDNLSYFIEENEIVNHTRTFSEVSGIGHKNKNLYLEKLPDYAEQQKNFKFEILKAFNERGCHTQSELEAFFEDDDIKLCVIDPDLKLKPGMSDEQLLLNNTIQLYNGIIYLMGNEVRSKLENLTVEDIKDYLTITRDDLNLSVENNQQIKENKSCRRGR